MSITVAGSVGGRLPGGWLTDFTDGLVITGADNVTVTGVCTEECQRGMTDEEKEKLDGSRHPVV